MCKNIVLIFIIVIIIPAFSLYAQGKDCVSVKQETKVLANNKKSVFKSEIYYNRINDGVVTHHYYPLEFVKISNRLGETQIYFPGTNTVSMQQDDALSTTNEFLYYFIHNNITDLGLSKEGFTLVSSTKEEGELVTTWQAPQFLKEIYQVRIVFNDMLPVYSEYISTKGLILKKIYYSRYENYGNFNLPLRITEITFKSATDSMISLSQFSDVRTGNFPDNTYFEYKIPDDAKVIH
jgi:hypothetical protein